MPTKQSQYNNSPLHVVILAAGKGSRLKSSTPKVLHTIAGKSLLAYVLEATERLEPAGIHVVVGHGRDAVQREFAGNNNINWVIQEDQKGTGHAVKCALKDIPKKALVLTLTADVPLIATNTLQVMLQHLQSSPVVLLTPTVSDPAGLGRIIRDSSGQVLAIVEDKDANAEQKQINEINSGIIAVHNPALSGWLSQLKEKNKQNELYLTDIVEFAVAEGNTVSAISCSEAQVRGINTRAQLAEVERHYQQLQAEYFMRQGVTIIDPARFDVRGEVSIAADTTIDVNCVIEGPTSIGEGVYIAPNCVISEAAIDDGARIHPNTVIEQAQIGKNVNIGPFARIRPGTKLAKNVRIGNFVETKNTQLAEGTKVNHLSYIGDSSVGENTNIGAGVITCNYDGANKHQTTIGKDVFVGSDCQLVAPVTIGDGVTIGAGSTITSDVPANELAISRVKQRHIKNWQRPTKESKK